MFSIHIINNYLKNKTKISQNKYSNINCEICGNNAFEKKDEKIICRKCSMKIDGRYEKFLNLPKKQKSNKMKNCINCSKLTLITRRGRCAVCYNFLLNHNFDRIV